MSVHRTLGNALRPLFAVVTLAACEAPSPIDPPPHEPTPPLAGEPIAIDGRATEAAWQARAMIGTLDAQTEVRLLRDTQTVFVLVQARDRDVTSDDGVDVTVGTFATRAKPTTIDGTLDTPLDEDVGWTVELAIPRAQVGPSPVAITATRATATWTSTIYPD